MNTTCLIIDDEKLARELLREYLEGFPQIEIIGECAKGNEAVEKINKLKPDLIFLDVQMPGKRSTMSHTLFLQLPTTSMR